MFASTPQSIRLAAYFQLPGRGAFWCVQPPPESCPRLRGKWTRTYVSGRKGSDSKMPSCLTVPPSASLALSSSPVSRWRLLVQYKHGVQCRTPSRSDRFNGVTGVAKGPKGRNRNLPWPPGKKVIKMLIFYLFVLLPQSRLRLDSSPAGEPFGCAI